MSYRKNKKKLKRRERLKASEYLESRLGDMMTHKQAAALEIERDAAKANEYNAKAPVTVTKPDKQYPREYNLYSRTQKRRAVERANIVGHEAAAKELGIKSRTLYQWYRFYQRFLEGDLDKSAAKSVARIHNIKDWRSGMRNRATPSKKKSTTVKSADEAAFVAAAESLTHLTASAGMAMSQFSDPLLTNTSIDISSPAPRMSGDATISLPLKEDWRPENDRIRRGYRGYMHEYYKKTPLEKAMDIVLANRKEVKEAGAGAENPFPMNPDKRETAIDIAVAKGAAEAAKKTGIPMNTISKWMEHYEKAPLDELIQTRESLLREYTRLDDVIKVREEKTKKIKKEILAKIEKLQADLAAL